MTRYGSVWVLALAGLGQTIKSGSIQAYLPFSYDFQLSTGYEAYEARVGHLSLKKRIFFTVVLVALVP